MAAVLLLSPLALCQTFELSGRVIPERRASVSLFGAGSPFAASTRTDARGRFKFSKLKAGAYVVAVFARGEGEVRQTIDIGPKAADSKGRVELVVSLDIQKLTPDRTSLVSAKQLTIPEKAWGEYHKAQARLAKRDSAGAVEHLKKAVQIAPQFAVAWNNLGTISYHARQYKDAEGYFRRGVLEDPTAFEPLVNLGGVLINLRNLDEAYKFNLQAVLQRPSDALANSQMGMTYFELDQFDLAEKYLLIARDIDPAHFSHPQLLLSEIALRRRQKGKAAEHLEDFLKHHPDWRRADRIREVISKLRTEVSGQPVK